MIKMLKNKLKDQRGLTLIELLAVIVILGIIAAIAVPAIGNLISNTENKATVAEGIQIMNAAKLYTAENTPDASATAGIALDKDELAAYLDNIKTGRDNYVVTIKGKNGQYTYELSVHASVALADTGGGTDDAKDSKATEKELLDY
jgi:type IV pilus assembly protein PilA